MEPLESRDLPQFIQNRKKEIATAISAVLAGIAVLIVYFQSQPNAENFARAEVAFAKWEASPQDENLYLELRKAMSGVPQVKKKYEAAIAQKLMNVEKFDEALEMAVHSLHRVKEETPLHTSYAETSLLIEKGSYQEALERAVSLKEKLGSDNAVLYTYNLLRIAFLQQELHNKHGEIAAWEELEAFLDKGVVSDAIKASLSEKNVDLTEYISERKKALN